MPEGIPSRPQTLYQQHYITNDGTMRLPHLFATLILLPFADLQIGFPIYHSIQGFVFKTA
jgi:hypothetical protein